MYDESELKAHGFVLIEFLSNHGNEYFTCVYSRRKRGGASSTSLNSDCRRVKQRVINDRSA